MPFDFETFKGEKREPGVECEVIDKVEMLDRVNKLNEIHSGYTFKITPNRGNFDDCRKQCQTLGGDLIQINFGKAGLQYHSELRQIMQSSGKQLWVGITDRETEGVYKYLNGQTVNQNEPLLYK